MRQLPRRGRIFGIRIRLHYTWIIGFGLIIAAIVTQFPEVYPLWRRIILGIATDLLFFVAVSIREIILNFVAIHRGISIKSITLFPMGGVPLVSKEDTLPALEVLMATTGLLINLVIAGIFYGVHLITITTGNMEFAVITQWLAFIYFLLAGAHFIPGFPLDGGRALRGLLWMKTGDFEQATSITSWIGWAFSLIFIVGGLLIVFFTQRWFDGLLLTFGGWVLQSTTTQSHRRVVLHQALQNITADDIMITECPLINQQLSLGQLVQRHILAKGQRYFIVADGVRMQGIVTMRNVKSIPKRRWNSTKIGKIMKPISKLKIAQPKQPAANLLEEMEEEGINQIPVLERGEIIGTVARDDIIRLARTRIEFRK